MTNRFRCPRCGGSHFGSSFAGGVQTVGCHDERERGCRWRGTLEEGLRGGRMTKVEIEALAEAALSGDDERFAIAWTPEVCTAVARLAWQVAE